MEKARVDAGKMNIRTDKPEANGRYVVFVRCASSQVRDWCEPEIATWHDGFWHNGKHVYGWIGPLPLYKVPPMDLTPALPTEYDL